MFVLLDVDEFKGINDRFGHDVGDKVIIGLAACMTSAFRTTDTLMRLGGDEFIAFAPGMTACFQAPPEFCRGFCRLHKKDVLHFLIFVLYCTKQAILQGEDMPWVRKKTTRFGSA